MIKAAKIKWKEQQWMYVYNCPACGSKTTTQKSQLLGSEYKILNKEIEFPDSGINLAECSNCGLVYKQILPKFQFISKILSEQIDKIWNSKYKFKQEILLIKNLFSKESFDLLDVGATQGNFLRACANFGGRRSALDILKYPELQLNLRGEFIQGSLDDLYLVWSQQPYDVITLFDVLEHLYYPNIAFRNLNALVKNGGFVIIETGDIQSCFSRRFGMNNWWYVRLFEHHIFWSYQSLKKIAEKYKFEIISIETKKHKDMYDINLLTQLKMLTHLAIYSISPRGYYYVLAHIFGRRGMQPRSVVAKDHFRVVLQKRETY
jgi:SAM-dependent methyltransferase